MGLNVWFLGFYFKCLGSGFFKKWSDFLEFNNLDHNMDCACVEKVGVKNQNL